MKRLLLILFALLLLSAVIVAVWANHRSSAGNQTSSLDTTPERDRGQVVTPPDPGNNAPAPTSGDPLPTKSGRPLESQPHPTGKPPGYPYADKVPGQPGFVVSPITGKPIDVRGMPAGTLVKDPTAPAEMDKPYFRVPESAVNEPG